MGNIILFLLAMMAIGVYQQWVVPKLLIAIPLLLLGAYLVDAVIAIKNHRNKEVLYYPRYTGGTLPEKPVLEQTKSAHHSTQVKPFYTAWTRKERNKRWIMDVLTYNGIHKMGDLSIEQYADLLKHLNHYEIKDNLSQVLASKLTFPR